MTTATTLTNIGFYSDSPIGGNVKYLIFDADGANLLFSITAAANASNTLSLIESPTFNFTLAAGTAYQLGIISDSRLDVGFDYPASFVTQNGLTSLGTNHNYNDFNSPVSANDAFASIPVVLDGLQGVSAVPEPAMWLTMILGFGLIGGILRSVARRSDRKFNAKIKRIAAGELA